MVAVDNLLKWALDYVFARLGIAEYREIAPQVACKGTGSYAAPGALVVGVTAPVPYLSSMGVSH